MKALGITTGRDLKKHSLAILQQHFGKVAQHYYNICRGIDCRPVTPNRESKSVGVEITFETDILGKQQALTHLKRLLKKALTRLEQKQLVAQTLTVKIKYHDFVQITRSRTLSDAILTKADTFLLLVSLLQNTGIEHRKIRLLGVSLSSLNNKSLLIDCQQRDIFNEFLFNKDQSDQHLQYLRQTNKVGF